MVSIKKNSSRQTLKLKYTIKKKVKEFKKKQRKAVRELAPLLTRRAQNGVLMHIPDSVPDKAQMIHAMIAADKQQREAQRVARQEKKKAKQAAR